MSDVSPTWYHYTDEDLGWGCVYRSYQNACAVLAPRHVPAMDLLLRVVWGNHVPASLRARWIEPGQLRRALWSADIAALHVPRQGETFLLTPYGTDVTRTHVLQTSAVEDYDTITSDPSAVLRHVLEHRMPAIIDDGIMGYALVPRGHAEDRALLLDPHTLEDSRVVRAVLTVEDMDRWLRDKPWMVWCVAP